MRYFTHADWESDIRVAQAAHIDGFALNIAAHDDSNDASLDRAFKAANKLNVSLFFSFDYLAQGPWPADRVIALLKKHTCHRSYFRHNKDHPLVSTFEGPGNAGDWPAIKAATNAFLIPSWSSRPPTEAVTLAGGVADGLFSFGAWPNGASNMTTDTDASFQAALSSATPPNQPNKGPKPYMMPVSPWFFTNLPGFGDKNWLWRGDELWDMRWVQVAERQPEYVQILSWNDFGESHYIGPLWEKQMGLFEAGRAPVNYARGMPHDGWRRFLGFYIGVYTTGRVPQRIGRGEEGVVVYYRTAPALACWSGGTTGNVASHGGQVEMPPQDVLEDEVFFSVLLDSDEGVWVVVEIGGRAMKGRFNRAPAAGRGTPGVYTGSVPFGGNTGDVVVTVWRHGRVIAAARGAKGISTRCENNVQNWNAVVVSG
jgi:hypothetical protein